MPVVDGMATRGHQSPPVTAPVPRHAADSRACSLQRCVWRFVLRRVSVIQWWRQAQGLDRGDTSQRTSQPQWWTDALPGPPSLLRNTARQRCRRAAEDTLSPSARHAAPPFRLSGRRPNTTSAVESGTPFAGPLSPPVASPPRPSGASVAPVSVGRAVASPSALPGVLSCCPIRASRAASVCVVSWP